MHLYYPPLTFITPLCHTAITAVQQARCVGHGGAERSYPAPLETPRPRVHLVLMFQLQCQAPHDGGLADMLLSLVTLTGGQRE
ncbi:hypothetical protein CgunFtcFv8_002853 [Champsocephalus gunnari]|uniref:Uncharacterized protein n=1 Tax=Champsocephalus gunnari TaxID=52237 RepID=A0AAN8HN14_CHAGU|nr:hypothetical protein CgunFtcFv8_002853 [Champsocephalus gunnari]